MILEGKCNIEKKKLNWGGQTLKWKRMEFKLN